MRVLQVSAEMFPLIKTGGLADVAGALPRALSAQGCELRPLLPGYPDVFSRFQVQREVGRLQLPWGEMARVVQGQMADTLIGYVLDLPARFDRPGNPYEDAYRKPYDDNHLRFAALSWAGAHLARGLDAQWQPSIVHAHDWHAGLLPACLAQWALTPGQVDVKTVFTIHNLAYQGLFARTDFEPLGLRAEAFSPSGLEFFGALSFLKAGIVYSNLITTVSPRYAQEIQTPEQGCGLDGLLRSRASSLIGILNGVDSAVWSPERDLHLSSPFGVDNLVGKQACKQALVRELGLGEQTDRPLIAVVSRLTEQKGMNLMLDNLRDTIERGAQWAILGSGDAWLESALLERQGSFPGALAVRRGYDEALAHRILGGADMIVVPSLFEPCGLTQLYGLAYGCVPIVRRVGGLADTVVHTSPATLEDGTATGFVFDEFLATALHQALHQAIDLYPQPAWGKLQRHGMLQDFSWTRSARAYHQAYTKLLTHP